MAAAIEPEVGVAEHEVCRRCGGPNVSWSAQSPLWNFVMRGNDINGVPRYRDMVCMPCFVVLAQKVVGLPAHGWRLTLHPEPEGLIYETPSGRVWDEERFLWLDPTVGSRTLPSFTLSPEEEGLLTFLRRIWRDRPLRGRSRGERP